MGILNTHMFLSSYKFSSEVQQYINNCTYTYREAAKKNPPLMARPLRGGAWVTRPWLGCGLTMLNINGISYINILTQDYLGALVLPGTVRKLYTHTFLR